MTAAVIPLNAIPNQRVSFTTNAATHVVEINTRLSEMFISVWRSGEPVLRNRALRAFAPIGYGIVLVDTEGVADPVYTGLGSRWLLLINEWQEDE